MKRYQVTFTVDGKRVQENVSASNSSDAKRIIISQYNGSRVSIINCKDLKTGSFL